MALAKPRLFIAYLLTVLFLVCMGAFTVYASEGEPIAPNTPTVPTATPITAIPIYEEIVAINATVNPMIVNASWLDGEMLRIDVVDISTGTVSSLAVRLSDFVTSADAQNSRYILIQAVDLDGNLSGVIQIVNPFYVPAPINANPPVGISPPVPPTDSSGSNNGEPNETAEPPQQGLTPDGTGTVVDNVVTQNEIEFFTVYTEEGNVFFLVVDRQRNTDNVYLLNAVTEADLMALAEQSGNPIENNNNVSVVPTPPPLEPPADGQDQPSQTPQPQPEPDTDTEAPPASSGNRNWVFIIIVVAAVGGVAYYFKIVKGKKSSAMSDDDWEDEDAYLDGGDDYLGDGADEGGDEE